MQLQALLEDTAHLDQKYSEVQLQLLFANVKDTK